MTDRVKPSIKRLLEHYGAHMVPEATRWMKMRCPFHEDRAPSASVNTEKQVFRCFVCAVGGDAYTIVQWREGIRDFPTAREFIEKLLGEEYGDVLPAQSTGKRRRAVFDDNPGTVAGQRQIVPSRVRRRPFTGT